MTDRHSTAPAAAGKPAKPYPDFPLFAHATGRWCKKIRGRLVYFGPWADPDGALKKYLEQKDDLHAGRKPKADPAALTIKDVVNSYLNHKSDKQAAGELSPATWIGYKAAADAVMAHFGKSRSVADLGPNDFAPLRNKMAKRWGPVSMRGFVQRVRSIFKHAYDAGLIDQPVRFGPGFKGPSRKVVRLDRARKGLRMFEAEEIRRLLVAAGRQFKAMILLGVNCGFGNADCGTLPLSALDLEGGWCNYHRPKTGINRRCPLWPETVQALREVIANRPALKDNVDASLVFVTKYGHSWAKESYDNPITKEMRKLLNKLGIEGRRNFYALRHTFETIGGEAKDQVAVDHIMGHARDDMASVYRERISDARLQAVAEHVRSWLFGASDKAGKRNRISVGTAGVIARRRP